jgi:hypothetical protein
MLWSETPDPMLHMKQKSEMDRWIVIALRTVLSHEMIKSGMAKLKEGTP